MQIPTFAQSQNNIIAQGNKAYSKSEFNAAISKYAEAVAKKKKEEEKALADKTAADKAVRIKKCKFENYRRKEN